MVSLGTQPANRKSGFGHSSPTGARAQDLSRQPARPDLWGARVSNDPGLPDPTSGRPTSGPATQRAAGPSFSARNASVAASRSRHTTFWFAKILGMVYASETATV